MQVEYLGDYRIWAIRPVQILPSLHEGESTSELITIRFHTIWNPSPAALVLLFSAFPPTCWLIWVFCRVLEGI